MNEVVIDDCHVDFIVGCLSAMKPENILELGMGTAQLTWNMWEKTTRKQTLTVVDNWFDWQGVEPKEAEHLRNSGVVVIQMSEGDFVSRTSDNTYDFLVSDADHQSAPDRFDELRRITTNGGMMFFHDTNTPYTYPILATFHQQALALGLPCYHFTKSTMPGERCERGLLFVINRK